MNGNVIRTITIRGTSEGLDKLQTDLVKLAGAHKDVAIAAEETDKKTRSLEQSWKAQTLRLDEAARAQNSIARESKIANQMLHEQRITTEQHAERLNLINQRYNTASQSTQKFTQQTGLARHELINLGRQAQDVGVSLASGQSPFMVLVQQGSQIADVFATSAGGLRGFFTQAIGWAKGFLTSTTGIVTAVLAIGGAAIYAASQFVRAQTTVEEALKEQIRLEKEVKALIDARTSAEVRSQLQAKEQTRFEVQRNLLDLQNKLNQAMEEAARIAERRSTRPAQVPGEMGEAPTAVSPLSDPGYSRIAAVSAELKAARISLKEFNAELGRIGEAHPELAQVVEDVRATSMELENAKFRAQAMSDVLKGIATDAQYAALGLGSIAQATLNKLKLDEAAAATERMAKAVLEMAKAYPGMSIEVAKTLDALNGQLQIAQARTGAEQMVVQQLVTQNNLLLQGKTLEEAMAIAAAQRAITQAQINVQAQQRLLELQNEMELLKAVDDIARDRIRAEQTLNKLLAEGVEYYLAQQIAAEELAIATERRAQAEYEANKAAMEAAQNAQLATERTAANTRRIAAAAEDAAYWANRFASSMWNPQQADLIRKWEYIPFALRGINETPSGMGRVQIWEGPGGVMSQFDPAGYTSTGGNPGMMAILGEIEKLKDPMVSFTKQFEKALTDTGGNLAATVGSIISKGGVFKGDAADPQRLALLERAINLMSPEQQISSYQGLMGQLATAPQTLQTAELTKQLGDKLTDLTRATDENTDATSAMTDVLSPYYSSDPRRTHLGFRAFAAGGIMTQYGELPLRQYQGGGMATSPQVAVFGEGSTPEAYVPIPSGRIPVEIKQPANSNQRPVNVTINVMGNADAGTVAALRQTSFQKAQQLRRVTG